MEAKRKRTKNIIIAAALALVAILMAALPAMLSSRASPLTQAVSPVT